MSTNRKRQFCEELQQQLGESDNAEHRRFLHECISRYNAESRGGPPATQYGNSNFPPAYGASGNGMYNSNYEPSGGFKGFMDFDVMIAPAVVKIEFVIGAIIIILATLGAMGYSLLQIGGAWGVLFCFLSPILGALLLFGYRLSCEFLIVLFKIHKELTKK